MAEEFDWYAYIDGMNLSAFQEELDHFSKEELKIFIINIIRGWAYQQKQNEIRDEQFYQEIVQLLRE
ncbi:MAG: hypothetical protein ABIJ21_04395 [Nanoarchaeota archaeon]